MLVKTVPGTCTTVVTSFSSCLCYVDMDLGKTVATLYWLGDCYYSVLNELQVFNDDLVLISQRSRR